MNSEVVITGAVSGAGDTVVAGCAAEAAGRTVAELARERDRKPVAILKALAAADATPGREERR